MTLKLFLLAVLFVISGGVAFSEYFKNHKFLSLLAMAVTIIATFYLFQDIYDDLKQPSSSTQPATVEPSLPVVVPENPPEKAEIPATKIAKGDFAAYFRPKQDMFETTAAFQARRRRLLQQFNDEVKQRNLDYQAGVLHLTDYNADTQMFTVNLDWQADWVKPFFGKQNQTKGVLKIGAKEAKQIYNEGTEKPFFIMASLNDNKFKIHAALMVEKGRAYSFSLSLYRYIDNGDGTVTDIRTGLIWLKNANCFGRKNWKTATQSAANLASGQCGLRDGSRRGMWRLPSKEEWEASLDKKYVDNESNYSQPALSNATGTGPWKEGDAFSGVRPSYYWSSTPPANITGLAWIVYLNGGGVVTYGKASTYGVWAGASQTLDTLIL
jgi:hypothetical protein